MRSLTARARPSKASRILDPRNSIAPAYLLAALSVWVVLPPVLARSALVPIVFSLAAIGCAMAARRTRPGAAIAVAVGTAAIGGALGIWITTMDPVALTSVMSWPALAAATIVIATPIAFAALGGVASERAGVMNIGLEGMMLSGALFAVVGAAATGSWVIGVVAGVVAGGALALLFAVFAVTFGGNQVVAGLAVNFLALGVTGYIFAVAFGGTGSPINLPKIPQIVLPLGFLGPWGDVISNLNLMVWLCLLAAVMVHVFLFRTVGGLRLRAIGEKPAAADTSGVRVLRTRVLAVMVSGFLAALGGAYLSLGFVGGFNEGMTGGRGYIALAAMIFGAWRPFGALAAALLFGFAQALVLRVPDLTPAASALFQTLPYVLTIVAVVGLVGRAVAPSSVGVPYRRSER